jgi:hypothetical protein
MVECKGDGMLVKAGRVLQIQLVYSDRQRATVQIA